MKKLISVFSRILLIIIASVLALVLLVFVGEKLFFGSFFFGGARAEFAIPGLWTGFVPQGFDKVDGAYIISGYDKSDNAPSSVYVIKDGKDTRVDLYNADGSNYLSHAGGVTHFGDYMYVAYNTGEEITYCDMFLLSDVFDGDGKATKCDSIPLPNQISYCSIYGNKLYAGAFYREGSKYLTPESHHLKTPAGDQNTALMMVYTLDETTGKPVGDKPDLVYSTLSNVQGMCITGSGKIVLSTSWSVSPSNLYVYDLTKASQGTWNLDGAEIPVTYLDSACLAQTINCPPMSEELVYENGRVIIMSESACMKYFYGKIMSGNFAHSIPLD